MSPASEVNAPRQSFPVRTLSSLWKKGLTIGFQFTAPGLMRSRVMLLNGFIMVATLYTTVFSIIYAFIGYQYFYGPMYLTPVSVLVLLLNHRGKFIAAQNTYLIGSLVVCAYWCYEGRGNGNEFILFALATTAILIFEKKSTVIIGNVLCAVIFISYKVYDAYTPFTPDPAINYTIIPTVIILNTIGVIGFQIAFFRYLAQHYDEKLTVKYMEIQSAEKVLKSNNEEIKAINDKLLALTGHLESMVKQKTRELQTYIDAIDVNLYSCITDYDGHFVSVNDQLVQASGYSREELVGKHYALLATPAHQNEHFIKRREIITSGKVWRGEVEHRNKSGTLYWFDCVVIPVKDDNGKIQCFLSIGLPITERKLHDKLQAETYRILESIAFKASHNIRGPIARIKGLANLIRLDILNEGEYKTIASKFSDCTDELNIATSELVNFVHDHQELMTKKE